MIQTFPPESFGAKWPNFLVNSVWDGSHDMVCDGCNVLNEYKSLVDRSVTVGLSDMKLKVGNPSSKEGISTLGY